MTDSWMRPFSAFVVFCLSFFLTSLPGFLSLLFPQPLPFHSLFFTHFSSLVSLQKSVGFPWKSSVGSYPFRVTLAMILTAVGS